MPRQQQAHELVAKLLIGHLLAVLVARLQQQREDVVALGEVRLRAPAPQLRVDHRVEVVQRAPEGAARALQARRAERRA